MKPGLPSQTLLLTFVPFTTFCCRTPLNGTDYPQAAYWGWVFCNAAIVILLNYIAFLVLI